MGIGFWELNKIDGKNPTHTGGFLTAYDQRTFSQEQVVARESGQNAMDAGRNVAGITQLVFQKIVASGENRKKILDLLEIDNVLRSRVAVFKNEERNKLFAQSVEQFLEGEELHAVLIRDYNTCGLSGKWDRYRREDHFARLVCALNLDDKADGDASSGGSFGLGKTAYAKSSNINTVVYHSVFTPTDDTDNTHRRLMASGIFPKHELNGEVFGGFAYFGKQDKITGKIANPFIDAEAQEIWDQIGEAFGADFGRSKNTTGTDILVLCDSLDISKLKRAVEDFYFPALISNELSVTFLDKDGSKDHPSVLARSDLDQFVNLYRKAKSSETVKGSEKLTIDSFNKRDGRAIGRYAFEAAESDEAKSDRNNCVAIMRGTGMVVNYEKVGGDQYEPAVGVFTADQDVHEYLQTSENAAHSEWSEHSHRLQQKFPVDGKKIVAHVNSIIKRRFQDFQKNLQPDVSVSKSENGLLAQLLTGALAGTSGDKGPDKFFKNPISISLIQKKRSDDKSIWQLSLRDNEDTPEGAFNLGIFPSISLAGEKNVAIKHMKFVVKNEDGAVLAEGSSPKLDYTFSRGFRLDFIIEIPNPGRKNYLVQCRCIAENGDFNVN
jgi:hypothetical protein